MWDNLSLLVESPILNSQLIIDGILTGAIFALAAYGMALLWGVMRIINLAQGEFIMLGGYVAVYLAQYGVNPLLGPPIAFFILYILGWLLYKVVIYRIVDQDLFISILATFGLSILLQQLANTLFGADIRTVSTGLDSMVLANGSITIPKTKVIALLVSIIVGIGVVFFLKKSRIGQAIRATSQNALAARILGIDTDKVYATTFALNAAICGAAGALVSIIWVIHPYLGLTYTVRAFMIVIVAGLGNMAGILFAATGLGVVENYAGFILGAQFQTAFLFALLVVILVVSNLRLRRKRQYLK